MSLVYYISPVGADVNYSAKRELLTRLASGHQAEFIFPLESHRSFSVSTALNDLRKSDLVIADLSLARPSCYFELGLAQAVGARIVLIASAGTILHQVGNAEEILTYSDLPTFQGVVEQALAHVHQ